MAKNFTPEEIDILKSNPYTAYAGERMLTFTREFKEDFMALYHQGYPPRKILPLLGYSVDMIGKARLNGICQQIRLQEVSAKGLRAGRRNNIDSSVKTEAGAKASPSPFAQAKADHVLLLELKREIELLKKELENLKRE